jgi:3-methyladenine DNA glycosylase Tag
MAKYLKKPRFSFIGTTICYGFARRWYANDN